MAVSDTEMVNAWTKVLKLSKLQEGQSVAILTDPSTNLQTLATAISASQGLGAIVTRIDLPAVNGGKSLSRDSSSYVGTTSLSGNHSALAALKACDLVLDLMLLLFSPEQEEILRGGTKILLAVEPPEILVRLIPTLEDREAVLIAADKLAAAKTMRVKSAAGTDIIFPLGSYPLLKEYGFVDEPGRWDHWPSGFVATWPTDRTAQGTIVLDSGDIWTPRKTYINTPIKLTVREGYVTSIEGGLDADLLKDYMEYFNDPDAYAISHVGWGLQKRARWSVLGLYNRESTLGMDARSFAGNFLFSLGPNNEVGGSNNSACHIDIPMRNCTVTLDGVDVVQKGCLTGDGASKTLN
ncbi:2,5-dihydroxypyridine 5,6-dioxygenase [Glaciimonas sp. PCH181]|uniref:2,5-dihydroxypyridine 5,6-dioxygenase n=1 Tax=Glaciimonas sp. PCH181 TaxID=2133943 RepID=UPI000D36A651|nr:2,5-dihydroxypyridine 5,6-dioxygenase [Glaciimonas sp. PCH181]PUA19688.1 2,5-dihydroxypyridine 5,6-dioxygenase [Glaciimonas sp. PCH181]